ncbi:transcriptional regulatory protein [Clostridium carboxidivorans P7]|nr:transcriptional regulatory protein [Clostridium carboxidivorans P7]
MALLKYPQKTFTREELINAVLGEDYDGYDRVIDTHVKNLRQKLETNPKEPEYIITVHGTGYRLGGE